MVCEKSTQVLESRFQCWRWLTGKQKLDSEVCKQQFTFTRLRCRQDDAWKMF